MPCLQDSHLALYAWQQFLYFSQPPVDGFFLQYSSSLKPAAQERHLALFALQQPLYFSQPCTPPKKISRWVLLATSSRWVLLAVVFLAQARGAREALGVVCPAARKWFAATSAPVDGFFSAASSR